MCPYHRTVHVMTIDCCHRLMPDCYPLMPDCYPLTPFARQFSIAPSSLSGAAFG